MSVPVPTVDLRPDHWDIVRSALRRHVPDREVVAFGSRATWTAKDYSDLDLAVMGEEPLSLRTAAALDEALGDSDLPFQVDVVEWARIDGGFRQIIRRHGVLVQGAVTSNDVAACQKNPTRPDWPIRTIDEIATRVAMGPFGSSIKVSTFVPKGVPIISGQHLHGIRVDDSPGFNFITREHALRLRNANARRGDVVLTHRGTIGQVSYIPEDSQFDRYVVSQSQFYIRCDQARAIPQFVALYLTSPEGQHQLLANTSQVGVPSIAQPVTYLRTLGIPLPPLPEQRAIAHIIGALDDKIEWNRRMNQTLEAMARALFKSWFVDFDPVRAKMEGRDRGLPKDIADLFPDRMVDSEKGEIPGGWEAKSLKDCMKLTMGQSPPGSTYNDHGDGLPFFQGRAEFGFRYPEKRRFCSAPTRVANPDDTLVSVRAPVGDINLAWERCCIGRGVAALRHRSGSSSFSYHSAWALQRELKEYEHMGTVFGAINKGQFQALKVIEPDPRVVKAFDAIAMNLDARIRSNTSESRTLDALRDTLLPKLISGEIRVPDAERAVESAT